MHPVRQSGNSRLGTKLLQRVHEDLAELLALRVLLHLSPVSDEVTEPAVEEDAVKDFGRLGVEDECF